jgi:hypothetical protein
MFQETTRSVTVGIRNTLETDLPIPSKIICLCVITTDQKQSLTDLIGQINRRRAKYIDGLLSALCKLHTDLMCRRKGCCLECSCALLGYLVIQMHSYELPQPSLKTLSPVTAQLSQAMPCRECVHRRGENVKKT